MDREQIITELMNEYGTKVLHLAYSYVRNHQTAEDLTQEIFLKCYQKLNSFQGEAAIQTWLYRIAINHCKDYVKSWHYRKIHLTEKISLFFKSAHSSPEEELLAGIERDELIDGMFALPVKYREVLFIYYFQDCTQKEISLVLALNLNTVKSRLARGKELLKESLGERGMLHGEGARSNKKADA